VTSDSTGASLARILAEKQWGGLRFRLVSTLPGFRLLPDPGENPEFRLTGNASTALDTLEVFLAPESAGAPDNGRPFFTSPRGWRMVVENNVRVALNHPPSFARPLWKAQLGWPLEAVRLRLGAAMRTDEGKGWHDPFRYPLDMIVTMYALASRHGLIVHGAGVATGEGGWIFAGKSGAGKSTISDLILSSWPGARLLNDDRVIVRRRAGGWTMYGTPWSGRLPTCHADEAPLRGIFWLRQAGENRVTPMTPAESAEHLLAVASIPWYDRPVVDALLPFVEDLSAQIPACRLDFRPEESAVRLVRAWSKSAAMDR
jgi:hypothetical protein